MTCSAHIHVTTYIYRLTWWPLKQEIRGDHATRLTIPSFHILSDLLIACQFVYYFFAANNILEQLL